VRLIPFINEQLMGHLAEGRVELHQKVFFSATARFNERASRLGIPTMEAYQSRIFTTVMPPSTPS
jgi:hypothetical protein